MAKEKHVYTCTECGAASLKWTGKCAQCGSWDTLTEHVYRQPASGTEPTEVTARPLAEIPFESSHQLWETGVSQFDRVLGGGIVASSVGLLGGTPGVGKSTLILQMMSRIGKLGKRVLYVSGEESESQIKLRSLRLGISEDNITLLASGDADAILYHIDRLKPDFVVIDSIQTMSSHQFPSVPGSLVQVRETAAMMHRCAKSGGPALLLIGHVTKEGTIAGPKVLEHLVDYVIYMETAAEPVYRYLYPVKNRYGSLQETGIFKMTAKGLAEVQNLNRLFNLTQASALPGLAYFAAFEGSRMIVSEVQALVTPESKSFALRQANGVDRSRLLMLTAVIQKHLGINLTDSDIYINFAGGFKSADPSVDMPMLAALISSQSNLCTDRPTVFMGEVSLTGRFSLYPENTAQLADLSKMGFSRLVVSASALKHIPLKSTPDFEIIPLETITDLYAFIRSTGKKAPRAARPSAPASAPAQPADG